MGIVNVPPQHGAFDAKNAKLIAPGEPDAPVNSIIGLGATANGSTPSDVGEGTGGLY